MKLLEMEDNALVSKIADDFDKAEKYQAQFKTQRTENYRLYKSKLKADTVAKRKGKANLFIPYMFTIVEQLKARTLQAFFTKTPYVGYAGNSQDDVDGAKVMEELVFWQMKERIKLPFKFLKLLTSIFVYGTGIVLYEWKLEEKNIKKREPIMEQIADGMGNMIDIKMGEQTVDKLVKVMDDPNVEIISIDDFFPDPEGWDVDNCAHCCIRSWRDNKYLKAKAKEGKWKLPEGWETDSAMERQTNFRDSINGVTTIDTAAAPNNKHEIISYYTDDAKIIVLNRKHILAKEPNPNFDQKKPIIRAVAWDNEKEFWGESIVRILESLQNELNDNRNQRMDNVSFILNKMWKKRRGTNINNNDLVSRAGGVIEVDDMDDLDPIVFPDVTASSYNEDGVIKSDMQFVSAVSDFAAGVTSRSTSKTTATTANALQEASNIVFNYVTMVIEITGLLPIADALKRLNQQYMTETKVVRLFDNAKGAWQYSQVDPDSIQGDYDAVSTSPRFEAQKTQEAKRAQLLEMFTTFATNPLTQQFMNVPAMMEMIMKTYDVKDVENLIVNPAPAPPMNPMPADVPPEQIPEQVPGQEEPPIDPAIMEAVLNGQV